MSQKISVAPRDARILGAALALGLKGQFTVKQVVSVAKALGDLRSEATITAKAREYIKKLVEMNVVSVSEEGRKKKYSLNLTREELKEIIPLYVEKVIDEVLQKLEKGEIVIEEEITKSTKRRKKKVEPSLTLDKFL